MKTIKFLAIFLCIIFLQRAFATDFIVLNREPGNMLVSPDWTNRKLEFVSVGRAQFSTGMHHLISLKWKLGDQCWQMNVEDIFNNLAARFWKKTEIHLYRGGIIIYPEGGAGTPGVEKDPKKKIMRTARPCS